LHLEDKEILERFLIAETKQEAFIDLMKKYKVRLYWHIRRMINNHEDTDDLLQDIWIKLWQKLHLFKGNSALYTFLYRIATNEVIDFINKKKKKDVIDFFSQENDFEDTIASPSFMDSNEVIKKLEAALEKLPDKQRLVFNMRYYDEMPYDDIAKILDTSVGALKASYHHAVRKIEKYLKNQLNF